MNEILALDRQLFALINLLPHTPLLNTFFLMLSGVGSLGVIWFVLGGLLFLKEEKKDHWFFIPLLAAGSVSYVIAEIVKHLVLRTRPDGSDLFSFPSGHATIAAACAVVLSKKEPRLKWLWFCLAVLISISRIYLGKHFPLDVLGGAAIGWVIGSFSVSTNAKK